MAVSELDELATLLPERDAKGRFFWQPFVDRIVERFDGLPGPDGAESFVRGCLATGCQAVPVVRRNALWEKQAPPLSDRRARGVFELRIRLGLFFAASLRYLLRGIGMLRVKTADGEWHPLMGAIRAGETAWHPLTGNGVSCRDFLAGHGDQEPSVNGSESALGFGEVCVLASFFFQAQEVLLLTPGVAANVLDYAQPGRPRGLFGRMLAADGQVEAAAVDIASVFLEALAQAVDQKRLRMNTRANGHVFITPAFWFLTTPVGLGDVLAMLRARRRGRRHDFPRHEVFQALHAAGHLVAAATGGSGNAAQVYRINSGDWESPLELVGLAIASESLPGQPHGVPHFDGTVTLKKESMDGSNAGEFQSFRQAHAPRPTRPRRRRSAVHRAAGTRLHARPVERDGARQ